MRGQVRCPIFTLQSLDVGEDMTKTVADAIAGLVVEITAAEADLRKKKETVNTLCVVDGRPAMYALAEPEKTLSISTIRPDQFYGQPLASAVRTILTMRQNANLGAATINEIFESLKAGGYLFETKNDEVAKASLRNSLSKNTSMFHKLPNARFGLTNWYPKVRDRVSKGGEASGDADAPEAESVME